MKTYLTRPNLLTSEQISEISTIAGLGFERPDDVAMQADTASHVQRADYVQLAYEEESLVAFSLYQRYLWRPSL